MAQPLVSVLINNYNNAPYLRFCIDSALQQSYPNLEVIVYDDGSTDDSPEILREYGARIQLLAPGKNHGSSSNFNQGNAIYQAFLASSGEIICLLDGDDGFLPGKVAQVVEAFAEVPETVLVQHFFEMIDAENQCIQARHPRYLYDPTRYGQSYKAYILQSHSLFDLFMQTSSLSFRRSYLEQVLPIEPDGRTKIWPDVRLTRRAPFFGQVRTLQSSLSHYRIHGTNWIHNLKERDFNAQLKVELYEFFNTFLEKAGHAPISYATYLKKRLFYRQYWEKRFQKYFGS